MDGPLRGQVALVTGGTRGAGRGMAVELGAAGATVHVTGRSTRASRGPLGRPETIEDTAELVTGAGGRGIAVRCVTSVSLTPGFLRSEEVLEHFGVAEANWRDAIAKDKWFAISESPRYIGRAVVALAADPEAARWSGKSLSSGVLAKHYGFTDLDGSQPEAGRFFADAYFGDHKDAKAEDYR
jgi:hypothetical protein